MLGSFYKLLEGGNVFKDAKKRPATTRISRESIKPSVAFVEKILGIELDGYLGTTGKKDSSGDIDIAVDDSKYDKKEIANKLRAWVKEEGLNPAEWVKLSGTNVHFKTPIRDADGNHTGEFAQLDLMFGNPKFQSWSMRGEPGDYKGVHRHIIMASIAKAQGMKWSYRDGLMNRTTNEIISQDPHEIVSTLLPGYRSNPLDLSVESILEYVYTKYKGQPDKIESLIGEAAATLAEHYGVQLPMPGATTVHESNDPDDYFLARLRDRIVNMGAEPLIEKREPLYTEYVTEGKLRDMNHIEDLILDEGPEGLGRAIAILRSFAEGKAHTETTIKWDGCISADSVLITDKGERTIADCITIWETEEIKVLGHNFKLCEDEFVSINMAGKHRGDKNWVEITLENGATIKMTEDHEVYTTNRGWVAAGKLTEDDDIKESTIK